MINRSSIFFWLLLIVTAVPAAGNGLGLLLHERLVLETVAEHDVDPAAADQADSHQPHSGPPHTKHSPHECPVCTMLATSVLALVVAIIAAVALHQRTLTRIGIQAECAMSAAVSRLRFARGPPVLA
jgi:hypothetical protein